MFGSMQASKELRVVCHLIALNAYGVVSDHHGSALLILLHVNRTQTLHEHTHVFYGNVLAIHMSPRTIMAHGSWPALCASDQTGNTRALPKVSTFSESGSALVLLHYSLCRYA